MHAAQPTPHGDNPPASTTVTPEASLDDRAFLDELRTFFERSLTPDLREAGRRTFGTHTDIAACKVWHRRLHERGWIAPAWPREWGGAGWSVRQRFLFARECALNDAPVLFAGGLRSLGPLLIHAGTPDQQSRYLPRILSGEDLWCQGFSEPAAGSDLAAIQTRAIRDGDRYILNGSKIWTTGAHHANRMFALVRTSVSSRRQDGLTFLLLDMDSPGLQVSPLRDLTGSHEFNQVHFNDVPAPAANRVGDENQGWAVARQLMQYARSNNTPSALVRRALRLASLTARDLKIADDAEIGIRLATLEIELEAFAQLELSYISGKFASPGANTPSILKLIGTELHQKVTTFVLELAAPHGAAQHTATDDDPAASAVARYLAVRAATIYSGTSETHRNLLARSVC